MNLESLPDPIDILPHRPPFLFLDRVSMLESSAVVGWRYFGEDEYFFKGHFPQRPVVPGVVLLESMAQALAYWALIEKPDHDVLLTGVDKAKFSKIVSPNTEIRLELDIKKARLGLVVAHGVCYSGELEVAQATIKGYLQSRRSTSTD